MEERLDARGLTEVEAIARYKSKNYPKPALTADIVVFSRTDDSLNVLLVERGGHPFIGKLAFPGGFANENEPIEETAARELEEETAITRNDIILSHLMDFTYPLDHCYLEVYVGRLNKTVEVCGDENVLYWSALDRDFFDVTQYAGEGNIGHIMMHIEMHRQELLK